MNRVNNKNCRNSSDSIEFGSNNWTFPSMYVNNVMLKEATISNKVRIAICCRILVAALMVAFG